jgi:hypothetical protein
MGTSGGMYTELTYVYSNPTEAKAVITAANGEAETQLFGADERYDKVVTLNPGEDYLVIGSVLWVDTLPEIKPDKSTDTPYDYVVVKVGKSLSGFVVVAIRKVDVS